MAVEQLGYGFGFTAFMLYLLYFADGPHKTAHYAICTGFMALGMMIPGMWSGWLQSHLGYRHFFVWVMLATIPGFIVTALIPLDAELRAELEQRCIVIYTGKSRISGETIDAVLGAYRNRESRVLAALDRMRATAESMAEALAARDVDALADLVAEQWRHQRSLHPAIPTPLIDEIIAQGAAAGAIGAKALGASGGGCVLLIAKRGMSDRVREAVTPLGELLPFSVAERGVERCR